MDPHSTATEPCHGMLRRMQPVREPQCAACRSREAGHGAARVCWRPSKTVHAALVATKRVPRSRAPHVPCRITAQVARQTQANDHISPSCLTLDCCKDRLLARRLSTTTLFVTMNLASALHQQKHASMCLSLLQSLVLFAGLVAMAHALSIQANNSTGTRVRPGPQ